MVHIKTALIRFTLTFMIDTRESIEDSIITLIVVSII